MKQHLTEFCIFLSKEKIIEKTVNHNDIINKFIKLHKENVQGCNDIADIVSMKTCIPVELMKTITRKREIVEARQISMYMMQRYTKMSLAEIGSFFTRADGTAFDHATVLHACRTINNLKETDANFRCKLEEINMIVSELK